MRITQEQLKQRFSRSFWLKKYVKILSKEVGNESNVVRALQLAQEGGNASKISQLFRNSAKANPVTVQEQKDAYVKRQQSTLQPSEPFPFPIPQPPPSSSGNAVGVGSLTAAPVLEFLASGASSGAGILSGDAYIQLTASADATGVGNISGDNSYLQFDVGGDALGSGEIAGDPSSVEYDITAGAAGIGTMAGDGYIQLTASATATGVGTLAGDGYLRFDTSGSSEGSGSMSGEATLDITVEELGNYYEDIILANVTSSNIIAHYGGNNTYQAGYKTNAFDDGPNSYDSTGYGDAPPFFDQRSLTMFSGASFFNDSTAADYWDFEVTAADRFGGFMHASASTFMGWVKLVDTSVDGQLVSSRNDGGSAEGFNVFFDTSTQEFEVMIHNGSSLTTLQQSKRATISSRYADAPVFIVATAEESGTELLTKWYLNGILMNSSSQASSSVEAERPMRIGNDGVSPALDGYWDEITFLSGALSQSTIENIWTSAVPCLYNNKILAQMGIEGDCQQYLNCSEWSEDGPVSLFFDVTGNGNSASINQLQGGDHAAAPAVDKYHLASYNGDTNTSSSFTSSYVPDIKNESFTWAAAVDWSNAGTSIDSCFSIGTSGSSHISIHYVGTEDSLYLEASDGVNYSSSVHTHNAPSPNDQAPLVLRYTSGSTVELWTSNNRDYGLNPPTASYRVPVASIDVSGFQFDVPNEMTFGAEASNLSGTSSERIYGGTQKGIGGLNHRGTYNVALSDFDCYKLSRFVVHEPYWEFDYRHRVFATGSVYTTASLGEKIEDWFPITGPQPPHENFTFLIGIEFTQDTLSERPFFNDSCILFPEGSGTFFDVDDADDNHMQYMIDNQNINQYTSNTVLMWISSSNDGYMGLYTNLDTSATPDVGMDIWLSSSYIYASLSGSGGGVTLASASYTPSSWSMVGYRIDVDNMELQMIADGNVFSASYAIDALDYIELNNPSIDLGKASTVLGGSPSEFEGGIKTVKFWDRFLSDAEISVISSSGIP